MLRSSTPAPMWPQEEEVTVAEETTHNGIVDPLTGAYSRALLFPRLAEELSRAARSTTGFAVMLFDVDYFKSVNDAYGHSRGDEVLRQLAERVGQLVRGYDVLFRYGGDEFVLLLPDTGEADAVSVALRLTEGVRGAQFPGQPPLSVSVSLGVAMFPKDADRAEDLLACADRRNYLAKQRGRACAVADDAESDARPVSSRMLERDVPLTTVHDFLTRLRVDPRGALRVAGEPGAGHTRFLEAAAHAAKLRGYQVIAAGEPVPDLGTASGVLVVADRGTGTVPELVRHLPDDVPVGLVYATIGRGDEPPVDLPVLDSVELLPWSPAALRIWLRTTLGAEPSLALVDWMGERSAGLPARAQRELDRLTSGGHLVRAEHGALTIAPALLAKPKRYTHQLPVPITELVGRQNETVQVAQLLAERRLVTLIGPAGIGKTRLSLAVGAAVADRFADGAVFVPLADATGADLVVPFLAQALDVAEVPGQALAATVLEHLTALSLLLIFDNYEHVVSSSPLIAQLLAAAPRVRVLVCSRERLSVYGEQVYRVPPLALPDPATLTTPQRALATSPALALFNTRARSAAYDFAITADNLATVVELCRRLDGLPLAIELAAAHVDTLSPEQMLAELSSHLDLGGDVARDRPRRQQTLRGAIDWSVHLLDPDTRDLFHWLGVFAGGFQLAALARIYPDPDLAKRLDSLVDKNLVRAEPDGPDGTRYSTLETIRSYAIERLVDSGAAEEAYRRHAGYHADLAERAGAEMMGRDQVAWTARVEREYQNLRAGFSRSLQRGEPVPAARIGLGLWRFWRTGRHIGEGREWLAGLLAPEVPLSDRMRAQLLHAAAVLAGGQDDHETAAALARESLERARAAGDAHTTAQACNALGIAAIAAGDYPAARGFFTDSLTICEQQGSALGMAVAHGNLTRLALRTGDVAAASEHARRCLELDRQQGNTRGIMLGLLCLGEILLTRDDPLSARVHLEEALELSRTLGDVFGEAMARHLLGRVALRDGDGTAALRQVAAALALRNGVGDREDLAISLEALGYLLATRDAELAARLLGATEALRTRHRLPDTADASAEREAGLATLRAALDTGTLAAAWTAGQSTPLDLVVDEAVARVAALTA
ncbi:MAG: diguanylate cyclase [Actinobacteria bacterium]|nr:MAG: diguanylate cyclase [Actinomycetota bacterium]